MHQHSNYRGPRKRKEEIGSEKNFKEIIVENFSNVGKEIVSQVQEALRVQYRIAKPKVKHAESYINKTNKN